MENSDIAFDKNGISQLAFTYPISGFISLSGGRNTFMVRVGYDANNNGILDSDESMPLRVLDSNSIYIGDAEIRGSDQYAYDTAKTGAFGVDQIIDGRYDSLTELALSHAKRFLQIFRDKNITEVPILYKPTGFTTSLTFDAFNGYFDEWLTHNSGAPFINDDGIASIMEYSWDSSTSTATMVATSQQIQHAATDFYIKNVHSSVKSYFSDKAVGTVAYFPPIDQPYYDNTPISSTVNFETFGVLNILSNVNGTIGRGRLLSNLCRYKVEKKHILIVPARLDEGIQTVYLDKPEVISTEVKGEVIDLYNFNYETGGMTGAARNAAKLQIGYGKGTYGSVRDRGLIYRDKIDFDALLSGLPGDGETATDF